MRSIPRTGLQTRNAMKSVSHLPVNDATNGWSRILLPRSPKPPLKSDIRAHTVVVGAGYAGLAAARRMAENRPNEKIVLLEAHEAGENASGRNSGFAIDLPHVISSNMNELEGAHRHMKLSRTAIAYHEEQIAKHGIQCDWKQSGKYQTAVTDYGIRKYLEPFMQELEQLQEPYTYVDGSELSNTLGTRHFSGAVYTPGCRLLNPAALVRGLADTLPENAALYEHTPVTGVDCSNSICLKTPSGSVQANRLIMGVNAFARYFGFYTRHILPFAANASLSRRLTADERASLGCKESWGVTPANAFASITMRYTEDHRILIRQNIYFNRRMRESQDYQNRIARLHKRLFDERFPMLPDVGMEYTWTGYLALSQNGAPGFGRIAENVYSCVCQNAIGVTKGTISGMLVADMACGEDHELIGYMQKLGKPNPLPPTPFLDIGVRAKLMWELFNSRKEV